MKNKLIIQLPNGQFLQVEIPPHVQMGGGTPPPPPPPPNEPPGGGDDLFGEPRPEPSKKQLIQAILVISTKYRCHHGIQDWQPLTHEQIADVLDGIRDMIYKSEGTIPPKK